jgi:hypothetical protein
LIHRLQNLRPQHIEGFRPRIRIVVRDDPLGLQIFHVKRELRDTRVNGVFNANIGFEWQSCWRQWGMALLPRAPNIEFASALKSLSYVIHQLSQASKRRF